MPYVVLKKSLVTYVIALLLLMIPFLIPSPVFAQTSPRKDILNDLTEQPNSGLINPALSPKLGNTYSEASTGKTFSYYFVYIWRVIIVLGGLLVIMNLISGAVDWITAGGEKGKVESARNKITGSVVGLIILVGSFAAVQFIGNIIQLNLLNPTLKPPGS